jgi:hypothetical protein
VTPRSFAPTHGRGPVGTGVHVLRRRSGPDGTTAADVWLTFLFIPLVPLGRWTVEREEGAGSAWRVTGVARPSLGRSAAWVAGGVLAALASLLPAWLAVTLFMGSKPAELGGLFSTAGAIIGALGWLDETRDRVPFRAAVRLAVAPPMPPEEGP